MRPTPPYCIVTYVFVVVQASIFFLFTLRKISFLYITELAYCFGVTGLCVMQMLLTYEICMCTGHRMSLLSNNYMCFLSPGVRSYLWRCLIVWLHKSRLAGNCVRRENWLLPNLVRISYMRYIIELLQKCRKCCHQEWTTPGISDEPEELRKRIFSSCKPQNNELHLITSEWLS